MNSVLWVLQVLLAVAMFLHGYVYVVWPASLVEKMRQRRPDKTRPELNPNFRRFIGLAECAAALGLTDDPLGLQPRECLPDWSTAYVKLLGQHFLLQACSRRVLAGDDLGLDPVGQILDKLRRSCCFQGSSAFLL